MKSAYFQKASRLTALLDSLSFIAVFILFLILGSIPVQMIHTGQHQLFYGIFGTLGAFLTVVIFLRIHKQKFSSIGLTWERRTVTRFLAGSMIGVGLFVFVFAIVCIAGKLELQLVAGVNYNKLLLSLLPVLPLALMEEVGFRSYPFVKIEKRFGLWWAQLIIAFLFAIYHILNGWGVAISFSGPFIWAFVFGLAASWSRGIAVPTGIHFALNIMQNLAGLKHNGPSIFSVVNKTGVGNAAGSVSGYAGIGAHLLVLAAACIATEWYRRRKGYNSLVV